MDEKTKLDEKIQAAIAEVAISRKSYCSAAAKYHSKSLSLEIKTVKDGKCVVPKKSVESKYDHKLPQENLFPLPPSFDAQKKFGELQREVDKINDEMETIQKIINLNDRMKNKELKL